MSFGPRALLTPFLGGMGQLLWLTGPPFVFFWILHSAVLGWEYATITLASTQFLANYILLSAIWCTFLIFIKRKLISLLFASVLFEGIAQINLVKSKYLFHPILPSDLFLIKNAPILVHFIPGILLGLLSITLLAGFIAVFKTGSTGSRCPRSVKFVQSITVLAGFIFAIALGTNRLNRLKVWIDAQPSSWDQNASYRNNGFLAGFLLNASTLKVEPPKDYRADVTPIEFLKYKTCAYSNYSGVKNHIVVVLLEAFWDPYLSGEQFSEDPIPNYRRLSKMGQTFSVISPVFGGGTPNAEFEILTGLSTVYFPVGSIPFQQYISRPIRALPKILRDEGYSAVAVHNYHKFFWNREYAYQKIGFERFVSVEDFGGYDEVVKDAGWPSDKLVFDKIVEELRNSNTPKFAYGVTVSTHVPFFDGGSSNIKVINPKHNSGDDLKLLEAYVNRMKTVDQYIGDFVDEIQSMEHPSTIVFLPDHQPQVAVSSGSKIEIWAEPNQSLRKVDGLVLGAVDSAPLQQTESFNCLPAKILRWSGLGLSKFMQFTEDFCKVNPIVSPAFPAPINSAMYESLHWLTYDRVFGMGYSEPTPDFASCSEQKKQETMVALDLN